MLEEIYRKLCKTENCIILGSDKIREIEYLKNYQNIIQVFTEISLKSGLKDVVFYIGIPDAHVQLPKIFIKKESYESFKYLPHINNDFSICIFEDNINYIFSKKALPDIVEEMISRAKGILSVYDNPSEGINEFHREFKAYWGLSYEHQDIVNEIGLSIITDKNIPIKGYRFNETLNGFHYLIFQEGELYKKFELYLQFRKISYTEIEIFQIEYSKITPPFSLLFTDSIKLIDERDIIRFRKTINKSGFNSALVIFNNINGEYFGWIYSRLIPPYDIVKGRRASLSSWQIINDPLFKKSLVERISFSNFTPERLEKRSNGYVHEVKKSICLIGLGSVGSNLLNLILKLPISKFHLVDTDILNVENIYRSQQGFDKVGLAKVDIAKESIINKNPFCEVTTSKESIADILRNDNRFLVNYDVSIVVIGNTLIEINILENLIDSESKNPIILLWVEPFLASGQMLIVSPLHFRKAKEIIYNFQYSVLNNNDKTKTYLKEGSCQSGYYPYSEANLTMFLCAAFPYIKSIVKDSAKRESILLTWVGDKDLLQNMEIELTEFGNSMNSFQTIITPL
ncbi:MAG: ThiF family adenylyltransferase [Flavobacteriales bacterium]|nr:ThiF family adenylyltransferase [Flavobacteriales bacterium]